MLASLTATTWLALACSPQPASVSMRASAGLPSAATVPPVHGALQVSFVINAHETVFADQSGLALERIVDLHESLGVPVDIYLTDPVVQHLVRNNRHLVERMADSPVVAVSYHYRPPTPYYVQFDWSGFGDLARADKLALILDYEAHAIDLETGEATAEPGGYAWLTELLGYPPPTVGLGALDDVPSEAFAGLGATFGISRDTPANLGDVSNSLHANPEHIEIKAFDHQTEDACEVIDEQITTALAGDTSSWEPPYFVNIKWHENDLYSRAYAWKAIYYDDDENMLLPPWDLDAWEGEVVIGSDESITTTWRNYEDGLRCVLDDPLRFSVVNRLDVQALLHER